MSVQVACTVAIQTIDESQAGVQRPVRIVFTYDIAPTSGGRANQKPRLIGTRCDVASPTGQQPRLNFLAHGVAP